METKEIIDALQMKRSLIRISHEIIEHNRGVEDIVLIGIKTRRRNSCQTTGRHYMQRGGRQCSLLCPGCIALER